MPADVAPLLPSPSPEAPWAVDVLQSLLERSLLQPLVVDGVRMFRLLWTLRAYAEERLQADPVLAAATDRRHGAWYAAFGDEAAIDALRRSGGIARRAHLARERDELVAACRRAIARKDGEVAVKAALAAGVIFQTAGPAAEGVTLLRAASEIPGVSARLLARAHLYQGVLLRTCGKPLDGHAHTETALTLAVQAGAVELEGRALLAVALRLRDQGDVAGAERTIRHALERSVTSNDTITESIALITLASIHWRSGQLRVAQGLQERGVALIEARGDQYSLPAALIAQSQLFYALGDLDRALQVIPAARAAATESGDLRNAGVICFVEAEALLALGRYDEADAAFERGMGLYTQLGDAASATHLRVGRAEVRRKRGQLQEAEAEVRAALTATTGKGHAREFESYIELFWILLEGGRLEEAVAVLDTAAAHVAPEHNEHLITLHAARGFMAITKGDPEGARACLAEGRACLARTELGGAVPGSRALKSLASRLGEVVG